MIALTMAIAWCVVAGEYAKEEEGWTPAGGGMVRGWRSMGAAAIAGTISLAINGVQQIPNVIAVVKFSFENQVWTLIGFAILIGLMIAGAVAMKRLEHELEKPYRRRG